MSAQQANPQSSSQSSQGERGRQQTGLTRRGGTAAVPALWVDPIDAFVNPFSMLRRMQEEVARAFAPTGRGEESSIAWIPAIEIEQRDNKLEVSAELPGLSEKDVKVEVDNDVLVIQGERKFEHEEKEGDIRRTERRYGQFYRAIALPEGAEADKARAEFKDGVLRVIIPLAQSQSNKREIPVQASGGQQSATQGKPEKAA
jgi:HSP20 family protein